MNMGIQATGRDDLALAGNDVCAAANHHVGSHAVHDIWVARLANRRNHAVLDSNIRLVDAGPVDNERVGDDHVQCLRVGPPRGLAHTLTQRLTATKLALVAVGGEVFLDLDPEICVSEPDPVSSGRTEHGHVGRALHLEHVDVGEVASGLRRMRKAGPLEVRNDLLGAPVLDAARGQVVAAADDLVAANLDERDRLGIARLEADRGAGGDVEAEAVRAGAVKLELRVRLDEVVVRADLHRSVALAGDLETDAATALVERDLFLGHDDGAGLLGGLIVGGVGQGEDLLVRHGEEAGVQGAVQVPVVGADGVVDGDEIRASGKGALDLDLTEGAADGGQDVAAAQHGGAQAHEVGDGVITIAD